MAARRLGRNDFNRPTLEVARGLLGRYLVRRFRGRRVEAMIVEVEAYKGPHDLACHARGGLRSKRVEPLYAEGGTAYVYLVYGLHWLLNFSTAGAGRPEGVLIRGVAVDGERILGPGRVSRRLRIDRRLNAVDVTRSKELWVEDRGVRPSRIRRGPRVGIDFAGPTWAAKPWRFWLEATGPRGRDGRRARPTAAAPS